MVDGERRQLTVFFCDVVDSTRLAATLDPEDLSAAMQAYRAICRATLLPFGAHIAQYLGDGILAYFGYPKAHESDAEQALRAGLAMIKAIPTMNQGSNLAERLRVRVGIHTGPVVMSRVSEYSLAHGDAVHIAFRLQEIAAPNTVVTTVSCLQLAPDLFRVEDLGLHTLRGFPQPIGVCRLISTIDFPSRFEANGRELTPFVGRKHEFSALSDQWLLARGGAGRAVVIAGEAGIGKSRLIRVLRDSLSTQPHSWLSCGCWPYEQHSAFHPLLHLMRATLGWEKYGTGEERTTALQEMLAHIDMNRAKALPVLCSLLSCPLPIDCPNTDLPPNERRQYSLEVLTQWILRPTNQHPTVLVIEDLHWSDPSTLELIRHILNQASRKQLLVVLSYRLEFDAALLGSGAFVRIDLTRLAPADAAHMVGLVAGEVALSATLQRQLADRSDGIPLFVEELTRMAVIPRVDQPGIGIDGSAIALIPSTLKSSLLARVDRLESGKLIAQIASVVGREFSALIVSEVAGITMSAVEHGISELLKERLIHVLDDAIDASHGFNHALIRDACYDSLLRAQRRILHQKVVDALETSAQVTVQTRPEFLAYHCTEGGLITKAIDYWSRAGEQAVVHWAGTEAVQHFRTALELVAIQPETPAWAGHRCALQTQLCLILFMMRGTGDSEVMAALELGRQYARQARNPTGLHVLTALLAGSHSMRAEYARGRLLSECGLRELSETATWDGGTLRLGLVRSIHLATLSTALLFSGNFRQAREVCEEAIALYDPISPMNVQVGMTDPSMVAFVNAGLLECVLGRPDRGLELARRGVYLVNDKPASYSQSLAHAKIFLALVHLLRDEVHEAEVTANSVVELSKALDMRFFETAGRLVSSAAAVLKQDAESMADHLAEAIAAGAQSETRFASSMWLSFLAIADLRRGLVQSASERIQQAAAAAAALGENFFLAEVLRLRGEIALAREPGTGRGEADLRQAITVARSQGAAAFEVRAAASLARCLHVLDRQSPEAHRILDSALSNHPETPELPYHLAARALFNRADSHA